VKHLRGFTLIEVLVALVIVAFGMGAVLAALSSSAENISALREKTLAEWVAMNQIADTRLNLNAPQPGVTQGDVKDFGDENWHWRQDVIAVDAIPGLMEIAVRVERLKPGQSSSSSSTTSKPAKTSSGLSSGAPSSFFSSSGGYSSGGYSSGGYSSGLGQLSSGGSMKNLGASALPNSGNEQWVATVVGFRGDSVSPANGESPDWSCNSGSAVNGLCIAAGTAGASSSGATVNPNAGANPGSSGVGSPGTPLNPPPPPPTPPPPVYAPGGTTP
jgi:general secretion pathway protein I